MSKIVRAIAIAAVMSGAAACNVFGPTVCDDSAHPGIFLTVRDSVTEVELTEGVEATAQDGAFVETAESAPALFALERAGTYTVTVVKEGYQTWQRSGVRVRDGECHVRTVSLTARLKR